MGNLLAFPTLEGSISGETRISGALSEAQSIKGNLDMTIQYESYPGEYNVTPKFGSDIELETRDRLLNDNVIVRQIPYFETPTLNGGTTVYIGMED